MKTHKVLSSSLSLILFLLVVVFFSCGFHQGEFAEDETEETGWNSFELRQYDSKIGRALSVDPAGEFPSPYLWVGNNPINSTDPSGGSSEPVHKPWVKEMTKGDTFAQFKIRFHLFESERGQAGESLQSGTIHIVLYYQETSEGYYTHSDVEASKSGSTIIDKPHLRFTMRTKVASDKNPFTRITITGSFVGDSRFVGTNYGPASASGGLYTGELETIPLNFTISIPQGTLTPELLHQRSTYIPTQILIQQKHTGGIFKYFETLCLSYDSFQINWYPDKRIKKFHGWDKSYRTPRSRISAPPPPANPGQ